MMVKNKDPVEESERLCKITLNFQGKSGGEFWIRNLNLRAELKLGQKVAE